MHFIVIGTHLCKDPDTEHCYKNPNPCREAHNLSCMYATTLDGQLLISLLDSATLSTTAFRPSLQLQSHTHTKSPHSFPAFFPVNVASASISGGDKTSYGSKPTSLNLALTASIPLGSKPCSIMLDTNAANCGSCHPFSLDSST